MLKIIDFRGCLPSSREMRAALPRADFDVSEALDRVQPILDVVRAQGAKALREFAQQFDGVAPTYLRVPEVEL